MQYILYLPKPSTDIDEHNMSSVCYKKNVELKTGKASRSLPYVWQKKTKIAEKHVT